ncbi:MAG TPA: SAM-dependent methyltransferase [Ktedonobacter sp.]|nr:SAM-dependent methyltransferase [Ktedonobacter sp.]
MTTQNQDYNQRTHDAWNTNAVFWDEQMGDGNQFQRILVGPATERLLQLQRGEQVLEIACGNGVMARRLAQFGARVVATDFSENFIEIARARGVDSSNGGSIDYRVIDATNGEQLLSLGQHRFDAIVCNQALMDMADIEPLMRAIPALLNKNGRFVFSTLHPCFNGNHVMMAELAEDETGQVVTTHAIKVLSYKTPTTQLGTGIIGQPQSHYYFFRPLHMILNTCFRAGLMMNGLEEPTFGPDDKGSRELSWANFKEIPPVFVARFVVGK